MLEQDLEINFDELDEAINFEKQNRKQSSDIQAIQHFEKKLASFEKQTQDTNNLEKVFNCDVLSDQFIQE